MRFPSNRVGRKVTGVLAIGAFALAGCNGDRDPKGFFDPTAVGRWNSTALVVPILNKLDVGVEQPNTHFMEARDVEPDDLVAHDQDYRISPYDLLSITVSDLLGPGVQTPQQDRVSATGNITLPSIGEIHAAGLTRTQLQQAIVQAYRDAKLIENAQVTVEVAEARGNTFSILGSVPRPGQYPIMTDNFRVLDALVIAGDAPVGSETLYVIRPIKAATPASTTQPAAETAPAPTNPFNVLAPSTAPAEELTPPSNGEGMTPSTEPSNNTGLEPAPAPKTEGNVPGGGLAPEGMVQVADGTTMPAGGQQESTNEDEMTSPASTQPVDEQNMATAATTQPAAENEGHLVTLEGQQEQIGGVAATMPAATESTTQKAVAETYPSPANFVFKLPPGATRYEEIRVPLGALKNGDMKYNIVIQPGDLIDVAGPEQGVYYVGGHVNRPGVYQILGQRVTLKQAIISAGMFDMLAIPTRTEIVRRIGDDKEVYAQVDLSRVFAGEEPDVFIKPNDVINVGTNILAPFIASVRNAFRLTYGFGFIYDRNFNDLAYNNTGRHP